MVYRGDVGLRGVWCGRGFPRRLLHRGLLLFLDELRAGALAVGEGVEVRCFGYGPPDVWVPGAAEGGERRCDETAGDWPCRGPHIVSNIE